MSKKFLSVIIGSIVIVGLSVITNVLKNEPKLKPSFTDKDPDYYLNSPWLTERLDWFFIPLPEKWKVNNEEINKKKGDYLKISNDFKMFEMQLNDFFLLCIYMEAKAGFYEKWDLDKSAVATMNQVLYNLGCEDINVSKLDPMNNAIEVIYEAHSNCSPYDYKVNLRSIRHESHIILVCNCFKDNNVALQKISDRIIYGMENMYPNLLNIKN